MVRQAVLYRGTSGAWAYGSTWRPCRPCSTRSCPTPTCTRRRTSSRWWRTACSRRRPCPRCCASEGTGIHKASMKRVGCGGHCAASQQGQEGEARAPLGRPRRRALRAPALAVLLLAFAGCERALLSGKGEELRLAEAEVVRAHGRVVARLEEGGRALRQRGGTDKGEQQESHDHDCLDSFSSLPGSTQGFRRRINEIRIGFLSNSKLRDSDKISQSVSYVLGVSESLSL